MKKTFSALLIMLCIASITASAQKTYSFTGQIGNDTSFRIDLEEDASGIVAGETTYYRKNGKTSKIKVYGAADVTEKNATNVMYLNEYDGTKICGSFQIYMNGSKVGEASWSKGDKELKISNVQYTKFPQGMKYLHPAKASEMAGKYMFQIYDGKKYEANQGESSAECDVTYKGGKVTYDIESWTPNCATYKNSFTPKGSTLTVEGKVPHRIYFDRNFIYIQMTGAVSDDMGWGGHASIGGCYVKK